MPITLDRSPKGRYPFGVFHTSMGSTLCTESELKSDWTVGDLSSLVLFETSLLVYEVANFFREQRIISGSFGAFYQINDKQFYSIIQR